MCCYSSLKMFTGIVAAQGLVRAYTATDKGAMVTLAALSAGLLSSILARQGWVSVPCKNLKVIERHRAYRLRGGHASGSA